MSRDQKQMLIRQIRGYIFAARAARNYHYLAQAKQVLNMLYKY